MEKNPQIDNLPDFNVKVSIDRKILDKSSSLKKKTYLAQFSVSLLSLEIIKQSPHTTWLGFLFAMNE